MRAMNILSVYLLPAAASVLGSAVAHADDPALFGRGGNASIVYQHLATQGAIVRCPELHLTARIGTGMATAFTQGGNDAKIVREGVYAQQAVRYPELHWSSSIGTGRAAGVER
jgi:hypothetical protein